MTQELALRPYLESAPSEETTKSQHQTKKETKRPFFHSSKYQLSHQGEQQVTYKGLLNPSSNWLGNPNCLITKITLLPN